MPVVNKRYAAYDVYIGRGSPLGNPYPINDGTGDTREVVIEKYRHWLWSKMKSGDISRKYLLSLDGKRLGCYCAPKPCHGDVILNAIDYLKRETNECS